MRRALVRALERESDEVVEVAAAAIAAEVPAYAPHGRGPLGEARLQETLRLLLRLFLETVETDELPSPAAFASIRAGAASAAADAVQIEDVLAAHEVVVRVAWEALGRLATPSDGDDLTSATALVLDHANRVAGAVTAGYLEERLHVAAAVQAAEWALVDAFLAGRPTAAAAARAGRELADAYGVLLLQGPVAREHLRSFEGAIARLGNGDALWRLTAAGANVLVPVAQAEAEGWLDGADDIVAHLSTAGGGAPLVAAVAWGEGAEGVARAGDDAVQVLRLVTGLGRSTGLYRLDDVLLEAALSGTAPGPAARLAAILAPLEGGGGRELLATLEAYLAHDADRRRTSAALHVHPNTLDYRLRRIGELTGRSPGTSRGLQVLGAALTLRRVGRIPGAGRPAEPVSTR